MQIEGVSEHHVDSFGACEHLCVVDSCKIVDTIGLEPKLSIGGGAVKLKAHDWSEPLFGGLECECSGHLVVSDGVSVIETRGTRVVIESVLKVVPQLQDVVGARCEDALVWIRATILTDGKLLVARLHIIPCVGQNEVVQYHPHRLVVVAGEQVWWHGDSEIAYGSAVSLVRINKYHTFVHNFHVFNNA